jgi:D-serine deaminase-like pyridoxal phosphate-dependent protein
LPADLSFLQGLMLHPALSFIPAPAAVVRLDDFQRNLDAVVQAAQAFPGRTIRIATKSIRVPALTQRILQTQPGLFVGLMTYSAAETLHLAQLGFDDLLLAYPPAQPEDAAALAQAAALKKIVRVACDAPIHLQWLQAAAAQHRTSIRVCLDLDMSIRFLGQHAGVKRSPIRHPDQLPPLLDVLRTCDRLQLDSLLSYEAQVAGLPDHDAHRPWWLRPLVPLIKRQSLAFARASRARFVQALQQHGYPITLVNGGGTGSAWLTMSDPSVTEITIGSGLLQSTLFDGYNPDVRASAGAPALQLLLRVCRRPDEQHATVFSGGFIASGPSGPSRNPTLFHHDGLSVLPDEGWGEVQTPLRWRRSNLPNARAKAPAIGEPVLCRPAKAGEIAERFNEYWLLAPDGSFERVPTYRGQGVCFG